MAKSGQMVRLRGVLERFWKQSLGIVAVVAAYLISGIHVANVAVSESERLSDERRVIRIAHSLSDRRVIRAFRRIADDYERMHRDVKVSVQSIPQRAYEQWVTTQLMGGTAPDLVQVLHLSGPWAVLAQQYFVALTPYIEEENPYNEDTELEGRPWRSTFIDGMEGGYFIHLLDFYAVPLTVDNTRIYYNKDLFRAATGSDRPPENFREWMEICAKIAAYGEETGDPIFPIAVAQDDKLFERYYPTLTGGMMEEYDTQQSGHYSYIYVYYGLLAGTFDLNDERIRAGFRLVKDIYRYCQPSFISDQAEQKRFLFIQQRAAMTPGNTRDFGVFRSNVDFEVGVFYFPQVDRDHPRYGRFYEGPTRESSLATFSFGLTGNSKHRELAVDFMKFYTSQKSNEKLCRELAWYPAVEGARMADYLKVFEPRTEGVMLYPNLWLVEGYPQLFYEQNLPLYLDGQISFDEFMDQTKEVWFRFMEESMARKFAISLQNRKQTEFNVARSKVKMLFQEAGELKSGNVVGSRTPYQIGMEIGVMHDQFICRQLYQLRHLKTGDFDYPLYQDNRLSSYRQ